MSSRLSIITINYNNVKGLAKTLRSVAEQSCHDFEYIVIDGNSTDGSKKVLEDFKKTVSHFVSEPDSGVYNAMNKGIRLASGDYLLFLNSGDQFANRNVIEKILPILGENFDLVYGNLIYSLNNVPKTIFTPSEKLGLAFFLNSFVPHPSTFIKRNLFDKIGFYNEKYKIISDWEFFLKAVVIHQVIYKHVDFSITDFDNSGISSDSDNLKMIEKEKTNAYNTLFPNLKNEIQSLKYAESRRILQIKNIQQNHPVLWKVFKFFLNILNLFVTKKEQRSFKKIRY